MRLCRRLISLVTGAVALLILLGADRAAATLYRAGDLLYRNPRTSKFLIQDRIVSRAKLLGSDTVVDLSAQMPPVGNQQSQGSCVAWAMGYYHKTHNEWVEHHWDDKDSAKYRASPAFIYNQICGGEDQGSFFEDAQKLMCEQGAGNMAEMPFNQYDCTTWPAESTYLHAISWRCDSAYWINIANDTGIARVKARLDSGYTTTLGIWVWGNFDNIQDYNYTYCASQLTGYNRGGHAVTFVGYNDTMMTADSTRGAFRMVNSWGTGWGQSGYFWMSYTAVKDTDSQGTHGITQEAYYVTDKLGYTPTLLGRVQITHNFRDCVEIRLGVGRTGSSLWTKNFRDFYMRQYKVVPQPFPANNIVFDMTDGASYLTNGSTDSVFVRCLDDSSDSRTGTVSYFSGQYVPWSATGVSVDPPVSIPDYNSAAHARARIPVCYDVGCTRIMAPTGTIDSGTSVTPACSVANYGYVQQGGYTVRMKVGTGPSYVYNQTAAAPDCAPGETVRVTFPSTSVWPRGTYPVSCSTELASDTNHANDRKTGSVTVRVRDASVLSIVAPAGTVDSGAVVNPQVQITNNSTVTESIPVNFKIGGSYNQNRTKSIASGATDTVNFPSWTVSLPRGAQACRCTVALAGDPVKANDTLSGSFTVRVTDAGVVQIVAPSGTVDSGAAVNPQVRIANYGSTTQNIPVNLTIGGSYNQNRTKSIASGVTDTVNFPSWTVALPRGTQACRCTVALAGDLVKANDTLSGTFTVRVHDAAVTQIQIPAGAIDSGSTVYPQVRITNNGTATEAIPVNLRFAGVYDQSRTKSIAAGVTDTVNFPSWTVSLPRGAQACRCTVALAGDLVKANDTLSGSFTVRVADAGVVQIVAPSGTVDSGAAVNPQVRIANYGSTTQNIPVNLTIGGSYNQNRTKSIASGVTDTVNFPSWTVALPRGTQACRCTVALAGDLVKANDTLSGSFTVRVTDAGVVQVVAPSGTVDSGAVVNPQVRITNSGTVAEDIPVDLKFAGVYDQSRTKNIAAGVTDTVNFLSWAANLGRGSYATRCTVNLAGDLVKANDTLSGTFSIGTRDAAVAQIVMPTGAIDSGTVVNPQVQVTNDGSATEAIPVNLTIGGSYNQNRTKSIASGATDTVNFPSWTVSLPRGAQACRCTVALAGDLVKANDTLSGSFTVRVADAGVVQIVAPSGTVDSGAAVNPQVRIANYGSTTQNIPVNLTIGGSYNQNRTKSIASGVTDTVNFPSWTVALPRGTQACRCTVSLAGDPVKANDTLSGTFAVRVQDVGVLTITSPIGPTDSGVPVYPQIKLKNFGNAPADFAAWFVILPAQDRAPSPPLGRIRAPSLATLGCIGASSLRIQRIGFDTGQVYEDSEEVSLAPTESAVVSFDPWWTIPGSYRLEAFTTLTGDLNPTNDTILGALDVRAPVHDVGTTAITAPSGVLDSGSVVQPQAVVRNFGNAAASFDVTLKIADGYSAVANVADLPPDCDTLVGFASWTALRLGTFQVKCSTALDGDTANANDRALGVVKVQAPDIGVVAITAPKGTIDTIPIIPSALVGNFGEVAEAFAVHYLIRDSSGTLVYVESTQVQALPPDTSVALEFPAWQGNRSLGRHSAICYAALPGDDNRSNDSACDSFSVVPGLQSLGWTRCSDLPIGPRGKLVKAGGALAYSEDPGSGAAFVYAFRGNNTCAFWLYDPLRDAWAARESIPAVGASVKKKRVNKGAALCAAGASIYATKGNNTYEFWCYDPTKPAGAAWTQLNDIPTGGKAVKEGTGLVAVSISGTNYIYVLKGSGTYEFYRYKTSDGSWATMANAPAGASGKPYKYGSSIAYDGGDTIWAMKSSYNEFFAYSISNNNWITKNNLPLISPPGTKKTKVKDGSQIASDGNRTIYALKGDNTNEFWTYSCATSTWFAATPMTVGVRKVKAGGALVYADIKNACYAFRGNNTLEFWAYATGHMLGPDPLGADRQPKDVQGQSVVRSPQFALSVTPNPFTPSLSPSISYSLPVAGNASLRLYDISGKLVTTLASGYHPAGSYSCSPLTTHYSLAGGVYLLKLDVGDQQATLKLVVE